MNGRSLLGGLAVSGFVGLVVLGCPGLTGQDLFGTGGSAFTSSTSTTTSLFGSGASTSSTGTAPVSSSVSSTGSHSTTVSSGMGVSSSSTGNGCTAPALLCGPNQCVDISSDPDNCGSCGHVCDAGLVCTGGNCVGCAAPSMMCGSACINTTMDVDNCGACENPCPDGAVCVDSTCTCDGTVCSDMLCTNGQDAPGDCGACGTKCNADQTCLNAQCACRPEYANCNGACVDFKHDSANCGSCGHGCTATIQTCVAGACKTLGCVAGGGQLCNGNCYAAKDYQTDPNNCGSCGNQCETTDLCIAGKCVGYFPSPSCGAKCPCAACGEGTRCCTGVAADAVCVLGTSCP